MVGLSSAAIPSPVVARLDALPGRFVEVVGDVRDRRLLDATLHRHGVDRVAHMAAITASAERERRAADEILSVNLAGLAAVLTSAADARVRRFVSTSSIAVWGGQPADGSLIDEDVPHAPQTLYAITKSDGEAVTARLATLHGLDWAVARLGRVFGPFEHDTGVRDTLSQIHQVTAHARVGRAVAFDRPCRKNWSFAPDVALRLRLLLNVPALAHRTYNLGTEHAWTLADWCDRLAQRHPGFHYHVGPAVGCHRRGAHRPRRPARDSGASCCRGSALPPISRRRPAPPSMPPSTPPSTRSRTDAALSCLDRHHDSHLGLPNSRAMSHATCA